MPILAIRRLTRTGSHSSGSAVILPDLRDLVDLDLTGCDRLRLLPNSLPWRMGRVIAARMRVTRRVSIAHSADRRARCVGMRFADGAFGIATHRSLGRSRGRA